MASPENDNVGNGALVVLKKRGRPPKVRRQRQNVPYTGKKRGRPNLSEAEKQQRLERKLARNARGRPKGRKSSERKPCGRPRKHPEFLDLDEEIAYYESLERRPVGRPPTNGVKLNIVRTGRGQGRPKKPKVRPGEQNGDAGQTAKKRGRPNLGRSKSPEHSAGRGRGRPSTKEVEEIEYEDYEVLEDVEEAMPAEESEEVEEIDEYDEIKLEIESRYSSESNDMN